jgi:hypothetical protein
MITGQKAFMTGDKLTTDPKGAHVCMTYKGRDLLGTVRDHYTPRTPGSYVHLVVHHFNGEAWPIEPLVWEVAVLERTYDTPDPL